MPDTFSSPLDLEIAFYESFERRDLRTMMSLWADDERTYCVHPAGHCMNGLAEIHAGWEGLFQHMPAMHVHIQDRKIVQAPGLAIHHVTEMVYLDSDESQQHWVSATNVFILTEHGWRLLAHHATPLLTGNVDSPVLH
ncbi:nuclear transport factor 2 family protein [Leeia sp. TBRC 13508]|uniref:Nuclear transport factor 2 family protein n=1 Tax=Leeia speluncae TaxID=2884804 RepID=A0ABS8D2K2_9NEIS|nr:nuclear transport factor 2 family protein [Leeia speluncae]MCB6182404.1 nuclear transport factor 2 family protein [Leeia speluncae]